MEIKHAIAGLVIGLGVIIGFALYQSYIERGESIPFLNDTTSK